MKRSLALLLVLVLAFALCACGSSKSVVGTWDAKMDAAKYMEGDPDLADLIPYLNNANLALRLEMKSDNTFVFTTDGSELAPALRSAVTAYLDDYLAQNGVSREEFAAAAGMTMDQAIDEIMAEFDVSELNDTVKGTYTNVKGILTFNYDDGSTDSGSWEDDTLTLPIAGVGDIIFTRSK